MLNEVPLRNIIEDPDLQQQRSAVQDLHTQATPVNITRLVDQAENLPQASPRTLEEDLIVSSSSSDLYEPSSSSDTENETSLESDVEEIAKRKKVPKKKKRNEKTWKKNVRKAKRLKDAFMRSAANKLSSNGILEQDKRGKHQPSNKLPQNVEKFIRNQILNFPAVESHYCRKSSGKKYLDSSLNISIMYRMYKELCSTENVQIVTFEKYRQIFSEYNLGFFKPKKDQCKKCLEFENMSEEEKKAVQEAYKKHLNRKNEARRARDEDKLIAKENPKVLAFNFDLQAVLTTPKGSAGQIFYLRKLAVFNFTIYNLGNQNVMCYLWDETKGKRGANEIASCVYDFIMSHSEIEEVRMMSDGCGGQQKNSIFATMCIQLLAEHPSLNVIDHRFFETGHTEMECDSIHSKIEKKSKYVPVYTPEGWAQLIRDARITPCPFAVKSLTFDDFSDFKGFSNNNSFNFNNIPWRKLCCLRYIKENNFINVMYKVDFTNDFIRVDCKKTRGRPKQADLKKAYQNELPISEAKWKDLDKMCKDLTIPKAYHDFYHSLKTNHMVRDNLPEPDISEESDTDD
ncbi:unnamed protein product [Phaedon cochleariae]|uniref:Uncharacterized protein n=1 Tax=Phaedon cochleariae TaxID=80249 RepID=A0A9N9SNP0_PHACE|nr:unnamed protein product [Phaedon cochleariae]